MGIDITPTPPRKVAVQLRVSCSRSGPIHGSRGTTKAQALSVIHVVDKRGPDRRRVGWRIPPCRNRGLAAVGATSTGKLINVLCTRLSANYGSPVTILRHNEGVYINCRGHRSYCNHCRACAYQIPAVCGYGDGSFPSEMGTCLGIQSD